MRQKKIYSVTCECGECDHIAVIHYTSKEAIRAGRDYLRSNFCECEFTDYRCKMRKDIDLDKIKTIPVGALDDFEAGLRLGIYSYVYNFPCPKCERDDTTIYLIDGEIMCANCEDELINGSQSNSSASTGGKS